MAAKTVDGLKKFSEDFQQYLLGEVQLSDVEKAELSWRRFSYQFFTVFVLLIGLPVWYFTTTPYRASLPYFDSEFHDQIKDLFGKSLSIQTDDDARKSDVWNQMTIFPVYNVHLVFLHEVDQQPDLLVKSQSLASGTQVLIDGFQKFSGLLDDIVQLKLSAEHFFDFSLQDFLANHPDRERQSGYLQLDDNSTGGNKPLIIDKSKISALTTEIDRWSTQPVGSEPLIKIAIFDSARVRLLEEQKEVKGLAVASWGGFVAAANNNKAVLNAIFAILKIHLGIDSKDKLAESEFASEFLRTALSDRKPVNKVLQELHRHKLRLTMHNLLQTVHYVNSLHGLKDKIEDMVISDEVAQLAYTAYEHFYMAYNALVKKKEIDSRSSAKARMLAEKAVTHYSLLEFLNFPADQKYGIYVPLFFPLLFPIIQPLLFLLYFLLKGKREVQPADIQAAEDEQPPPAENEEQQQQPAEKGVEE